MIGFKQWFSFLRTVQSVRGDNSYRHSPLESGVFVGVFCFSGFRAVLFFGRVPM